MRNVILLLICLGFSIEVKAQANLYFPPTTLNANWDTISPTSLGWCTTYLDTVYDYLNQSNSKGFIILKDGKIAVEKYFGTFTSDSIWYWASAGKTLTSFLTGVAQEEGFLNINDTSSKYLGNGWTTCTPTQENLITIRNQLTMTSGLEDNVPDDNCMIPACLTYKADAGTRWAYHNAPYRLLQNVIQSATGVSFNQYMNTRLKTPTGMIGFWYDTIYYSRVRDMARFGLLILNRGIWENDTLMHDTSYFQQMTNTSQLLNPSYGYLWWLNGKGSHMLPQTQLVLQTDIIPNAPDDLIAGLGKNDQKVYVIPSLNMVVIRMGESAGTSLLTLSSFDNALWGKLMQVFCNSTGIEKQEEYVNISFHPNPANENFRLSENITATNIRIFTLEGKNISNKTIINQEVDIRDLPHGAYILEIFNKGKKVGKAAKLVKLPF